MDKGDGQADELLNFSGSRNVRVARGQRECLRQGPERHGKERLEVFGVNDGLFAFRPERNDKFAVMSTPRDELPNVDDIRYLAKVNLPSHYVIKDVRVSRGPDTLIGAPDDFEVVIEYENLIGEGLIGSFEDIEAYQYWADPLVQGVRSEWPSKTIRIGFFERIPFHDNPAEY